MPSTLIIYLVASITVAGAAWVGYNAIDGRGYNRCKAEVELANLHAAEEAHQVYLAEVARGDAISAKLAITERRLNETKSEYLAYAHGIVGNCPAELGVFLAAEAASAANLPKAPSPLVDSPATLEASIIAANIAENRGRFEINYARCAALIDWHNKTFVTDDKETK